MSLRSLTQTNEEPDKADTANEIEPKPGRTIKLVTTRCLACSRTVTVVDSDHQRRLEGFGWKMVTIPDLPGGGLVWLCPVHWQRVREVLSSPD